VPPVHAPSFSAINTKNLCNKNQEFNPCLVYFVFVCPITGYGSGGRKCYAGIFSLEGVFKGDVLGEDGVSFNSMAAFFVDLSRQQWNVSS